MPHFIHCLAVACLSLFIGSVIDFDCKGRYSSVPSQYYRLKNVEVNFIFLVRLHYLCVVESQTFTNMKRYLLFIGIGVVLMGIASWTLIKGGNCTVGADGSGILKPAKDHKYRHLIHPPCNPYWQVLLPGLK